MAPEERRSVEAGLRVQLELSLRAPSRARDALGRWLRGLGFSQEVERVMLLVVSELVTNAVTHAGSAPLLRADLRDERLRLEVHDDSARAPQMRTSGGATGGFGLRVVADATDAWGWEPTSTGKMVWTELRA